MRTPALSPHPRRALGRSGRRLQTRTPIPDRERHRCGAVGSRDRQFRRPAPLARGKRPARAAHCASIPGQRLADLTGAVVYTEQDPADDIRLQQRATIVRSIAQPARASSSAGSRRGDRPVIRLRQRVQFTLPLGPKTKRGDFHRTALYRPPASARTRKIASTRPATKRCCSTGYRTALMRASAIG